MADRARHGAKGTVREGRRRFATPNAIDAKRKKGGAVYASGKTLVVFLNARVATPWYPSAVAKQLPHPLHFATVYVVGTGTLSSPVSTLITLSIWPHQSRPSGACG